MKNRLLKLAGTALAVAVISGGIAVTASAKPPPRRHGSDKPVLIDVIAKPQPTTTEPTEPTATAVPACPPYCGRPPAEQVKPKPGQSEPTNPPPPQ